MPSKRDMSLEHERRFLVTDLSILKRSVGAEIEQAYLWNAGGYAVRVRRTRSVDESGKVDEEPALFTLKGPRKGFTRFEAEMEIPVDRAAELIELSPHRIVKTRYGVISEDETWAVDVFHGASEGLVIAEFEAGVEAVTALRHGPAWCGREVTQDVRYNNEYIARNPWPSWRDRPS